MPSRSHLITVEIEKHFKENANSCIAREQEKYMRHRFRFFGIQKPLRSSLQKIVLEKHLFGVQEEAFIMSILEQLWRKKEREFQYTACDLAEKLLRTCSLKLMSCFETMIRQKSWWDTVDRIASNFIGSLLLKHPGSEELMDCWIQDSNLWIRRSALLFQLRYKGNTNETRLFNYCRQTMLEEDFFIRKAIGWALREYSKTSPDSVRAFIETHQQQLSPLTIREGTKILRK